MSVIWVERGWCACACKGSSLPLIRHPSDFRFLRIINFRLDVIPYVKVSREGKDLHVVEVTFHVAEGRVKDVVDGCAEGAVG